MSSTVVKPAAGSVCALASAVVASPAIAATKPMAALPCHCMESSLVVNRICWTHAYPTGLIVHEYHRWKPGGACGQKPGTMDGRRCITISIPGQSTIPGSNLGGGSRDAMQNGIEIGGVGITRGVRACDH